MRIAAIDPSQRHFGMVKLEWHGLLGFSILEMKLVNTEKSKDKKVRVNSDDLSCAREIHDACHEFIADCEFVFSEVPSGAQSASAAKSFGICIGILASVRIPLIEVQPLETKKASIGKKTASKKDIIAWAVTHYPEAPWIRALAKPYGFTLANEHLADAVAIAHAGVKTEQFRAITALMKRAA